MPFEMHNIVGGIGAAIVLGTYLALQVNRIEAQSMKYSVLNAIGSGLIVLSLTYRFNLPAFIVESAWLMISFVGAIVTWKNSREARKLASSTTKELPPT